MLSGGRCMVGLDFAPRTWPVPPLRALPSVPASTTFIGRAKQFDEAAFSGIVGAAGEPHPPLVRDGPRARRK